MDILNETIKILSKEEIINYKLYSNRTKTNTQRKDNLLFDLLRKNKSIDDSSFDDNQVFKKIYPDVIDKNLFYRLKNRVLTDVNISLIQFYSSNDNVYSQLSLYKIFSQKNNFQLAKYHLKKSETVALKTQDFSLLDIIYTEFINLSIQFAEIDPQFYITKREENQALLNENRVIDDTLALLIYELKRNQNFSSSNRKISKLLTTEINKLKGNKHYEDNVVFKTKLYNTISRLLLAEKNYESLEKYVYETYNDFLSKNYFTKNNHSVKLQMLSYLCNALFINKKYAESLDYIDLLYKAMLEHKKVLYNNYVFFYYNTLVNNYSIISPPKAIDVLLKVKEDKFIQTHPTYLGYVYLNLAGAYFDSGEYKIALKNIIKLKQHHLFATIDKGFEIKIWITEIILRVETKDFEYALKLIELLFKDFKVVLNTKENKFDNDFISLIKILLFKYSFKTTQITKGLVVNFCNTKHVVNGQTIIDYNKWLTQKFNLNA